MIGCPRCQAANSPGRRFCAECGASLAVACTECGFSNEPGVKFCGGCGSPLASSAGKPGATRFSSPQSYTPKHLAEKILTSKSALEGERKQVTVLFADLKGSMELLADRDPEDARKLLDPVLERMMEAVHRYEGTVNQVMGELATHNLAALPADCIYEYFGLTAPASVYDRVFLVMSLAQLGRFAEAVEVEAEAIRLAEPTHHAFTVGMAHFAAGTLHLLKDDAAKACSLLEHGIAAFRTGNLVVQLPQAVASSAWALAQLGNASEALNRLREGEQLVQRQAARGIVGRLGWAYVSLGRAALLVGRLDDARSLGDRAIEFSPGHQGFMAHALHLLGDIANHPDRFDAEGGEAHYRQALALAEPRGMRPLVAHCHLGLAKLYRRTSKREQAREHLTTATTIYREMDMRSWLEQAVADSKELG